jgi:hypothetical protein
MAGPIKLFVFVGDNTKNGLPFLNNLFSSLNSCRVIENKGE